VASLRNIIAVNFAKFTSSLVKTLKLGSGSALPGRVALKLAPNVLQDFKTQIGFDNPVDIVVTGTNGKTTSTGMLKKIFEEYTKDFVISNAMGANLYYGIVSEFVNSSDSSARLKSKNLVLEIDEASVPALAKILKPKYILLTNIYRDQLDRFGELDATLKLIVNGIEASINEHHRVLVVYNADDENLASLPNVLVNKVDFYSYSVKSENKITNLDSTNSNKQVESDFFAELIEQDIDYSVVSIGDQSSRVTITLNLPGLYNVYNACSAAAIAYKSGIDLEAIKYGLENYQVNFGRAAIKKYNGKLTQTFLIKNPTGTTEVLKHLARDHDANFLIALNDNYADGRDVSWIWDAEFEHLTQSNNTIYCTGHRARDLALRLKYAGISEEKLFIDEDIKKTLDLAILKTTTKLYILPTYTALLNLEKLY
jgi:lipid II isoglutaminyl synthase (glutamine-hydrolysing)